LEEIVDYWSPDLNPCCGEFRVKLMALLTERVPQNVSGKFYVDSSCIYCELCVEIASSIFRECNEQGWAYVFKQPDSLEELKLCIDAVESCPTESIGIDGGTD
jgi:ferredoxin